jgi:hypothetical protein
MKNFEHAISGKRIDGCPRLTRAKHCVARSTQLSIKTSDGAYLTLHLKNDSRIVGIAKGSIGDVGTGSYVSGSGTSDGFGRAKASDVRIYPRSMVSGSSGSNTIGSVIEQLGSSDNRELTLQYNSGKQKIIVDRNTPVSIYGIGDKSELKPGVRINVPAATKRPDGSLESDLIRFGRDGFCPECNTTINCVFPKKLCEGGKSCCD